MLVDDPVVGVRIIFWVKARVRTRVDTYVRSAFGSTICRRPTSSATGLPSDLHC